MTVISSVGQNYRLEMAVGGSGVLILAVVRLPNKPIFVLAYKRLQLELLLGCRAGLAEGGGGWWVAGDGKGRLTADA